MGDDTRSVASRQTSRFEHDNENGGSHHDEDESTYSSEDDYLGDLHHDSESDDEPKRKSRVMVNKNAGFVRIRRIFPDEPQQISRRASMVPGFIMPNVDEDDDFIPTPVRNKSVISRPSTGGRRSSRQGSVVGRDANGPPTEARKKSVIRPSVLARRPQKPYYEITVAQMQEIRDVFDLFDTDGSASIDPSELRIVMRALGFNLTQEEVLEITKWFDKDDDEDEALSFDEFLYVMAVKLSQQDESAEIKASFALFDVDKRGKVGKRELAKIAKELGDPLTEEDLAMMIHENDFDGDGELGEADWAKIFAAAKMGS
ncbi:EF-hand [Rhizoclosmatium globosum]|uniref:EF-hand n=1 Tax=Rhizoclosmatium globosum TaxID=329046 RepID=A0A1Y1ZZF6_9FUNG|nr:EF-hand [Rhizoclosmatium globosum]|eukprot:ORY15642.1 EF-hand [Rhizoclosmatium globosum]